ncbi:MAG TPA: hypothetical protein VJH92_04850 [Candidatus Nanoarchaeia archaeon]|nr:hypothetical protein [Candidatus Nanoarchaeia archaeon]
MAKLKRVDVLKMASFLGLFGVFVGFIVALFAWVVVSMVSALFASATDGGLTTTNSLLDFSWIYIIVFPIIFGIGNFVIALIFTPLSNLFLKIVKGIDFELDLEGKTY